MIIFPSGKSTLIPLHGGLACSRLERPDYTRRGQKLTSSRLYIGVMPRIQFGISENTPYLYYEVGDLMAIAKRKQQQVDELRMAGLNDSRKLRVNVKMCAQSERRYV